MNATKLAPWVLICIIAFSTALGIGFALSSNAAAAFSKDSGASTSIGKLLGEAVNDPKPNIIIRLGST